MGIYGFSELITTLPFAFGVTAIIQLGGSVQNAETIDICNQYGVTLVLTGISHFRR